MDYTNDLPVQDILDNGGLDDELTIGTSPVELKVGVSRKENRKLVIFQPIDADMKYGFSNSTQNIPVFQNQTIALNVSENTEIWIVATTPGKKCAVGEL